MLPKFRKIWGPQEERISGGRRENLVKIGFDCFWQEQRGLPKFRKFGAHKERELMEGTTVHPWCGVHSTSINYCGVWGARVGIQVFKKEFHIHIHLD